MGPQWGLAILVPWNWPWKRSMALDMGTSRLFSCPGEQSSWQISVLQSRLLSFCGKLLYIICSSLKGALDHWHHGCHHHHHQSYYTCIKEINPGCSLEGLMLKLKLQYFGHLMWRVDSLEKTLMLEAIGAGEEKGTTEDERAGWHHRFNGHEFE